MKFPCYILLVEILMIYIKTTFMHHAFSDQTKVLIHAMKMGHVNSLSKF